MKHLDDSRKVNQTLQRMKLYFEPIWPWPVVALAAIAMVFTVVRLYRQRLRRLTPGYRRAVLTLRIVAAALLVFAMFRPGLEFREQTSRETQLIILADRSRSMSVPDGPGQVERRQSLIQQYASLDESLEELGELTDIRVFDFAEDLTQIDELTNNTEGTQTPIGMTLESVLEEARSTKLLAVMLMSDGAQRAVFPNNSDPRAIARRFGDLQVPIYTSGFGTTSYEDTATDVSVEDVLVDPLVFEKQTVPVTARIRCRGLSGQPVIVRLLIEDRTGKNPGESGELKPAPALRDATPIVRLDAPDGSDVVPVELSFVPEAAGEFKIRIAIEPVGGEVRLSNNQFETIVTVQEGGLRVLYVDRLRWEFKFLKRIRRSEKIELDILPIRVGPLLDSNRLEGDLFEPGAYDAYIIGDVPASVLGKSNLAELAKRVREGAGLMMLGGDYSFAPGGYGGTPIAEVLPVRMPPGRPSPDALDQYQVEDEIAMVPTPAGLNRFLMRLDNDPATNRQLWQGLPKLSGASRLQDRGGLAEVLAATTAGLPLLISYEYGKARVLAFAGDTTWQWAMGTQAQQNAHERFWSQIILWLTHREADGNTPVWITADPRNFAPSQTASLRLGARDDDGNPLPKAQFDVEIVKPDGGTAGGNVVQRGEDFGVDFSDTESPGDFWAHVRATQDGEFYGDAWTRFLVNSRDLELDYPAADHELLDEIALLSGGRFLKPEQLNEQLQTWIEDGLPNRELVKVRQVTLWDNWPFLLAFCLTLSTEWFLRKRRGLV